MLRRASAVVAVAAALGAVAAPVAGAQGENVVQAIKAQDKIIHANPTYKSLKNFKKLKTTAEIQAAIPKFRTLAKLADNAASAVAKASATSAQKLGQKDWVTGVRDVGTGVDDLATALQDAVDHNTAGADALAAKAEKILATGNTIGTKGDKLLHLPSSD